MNEYPVRHDRDVHLLNVPDKMLTELVLGVDDPANTANKYGFDDVAFESLQEQPSFQRALAQRTAELESKGELFKVKARALADDLLEKVYLDALSTQDPKVRLDNIKFLAGAGGVAQPVAQRADTGRQVNIQINLGAAGTHNVRMNFDDLFEDNDALVYDQEEEDDDRG